MLICNPKKWAVDRFLEERISADTWGVGETYKYKIKAGHLAILRVGADTRTKKELQGRPKLRPGIFAFCEVIGEVFPGSAANEKYWSDAHRRPEGFPTVKIRYLRTMEKNPVSLETLKALNNIDQLIVNGHQNSLLPILKEDFDAILNLVGVTASALGVTSADNTNFKDASPTVKEMTVKRYERGPEGDEAKKLNDYKCQICEALKENPIGFRKKDSELHYVEAHHVVQVSSMEENSLSLSNIMTVCANHHRWLHYGNCSVEVKNDRFVVSSCDFDELAISRLPHDHNL